jgi:hypothetical protein
MSGPQTHLVPVTLPGRGDTFLDQSMVPKIHAFVEEAHKRGVDIRFNSAYRSPEQQERLHRDPTAITPAAHSLHSAGFAVDVEGFMRMSAHDQKAVREAAETAGLKWGGGFHHSDPVHFYADPPIDRNTAIANATRQYHEYQQQHGRPSASQTNVSPEHAGLDRAPHAHTLEQGARGQAVHDLQAKLAGLGYLDAKGVDGNFGIHTRQAVEHFQHDHHLAMDGKVGPLTQQAMHSAPPKHASAHDLSDPKNPDHAMFEQALTGVRTLNAQSQPTEQQRLNVAAALVVEAKHEGFTRIDQVALGDRGNRIYIAQHPTSPMEQTKVGSVDAVTALQTPMIQSSATAATATAPSPSATQHAPAVQASAAIQPQAL